MEGDFIEKLHRLYEVPDQVLYRWKISRSTGSRYCALSGVRFESLSCRNGDIVFSSAAGYLQYQFGRPAILFSDHDMVMAVSGTRAGCNFPSRFRKEDEEISKTPNCGSYNVGPNSPAWLVGKVVSMGYAPYYNTFKIVQPEWYRSTKQPESLKPLFNAELIRLIGGNKNDNLDKLEELFKANLERFGSYEADGYVIPFSLVVAGGRTSCATKGISVKGGALHCMDGELFRAEVSRLKWRIKTGEEQDGGAADLARLAAGK